MSIGLDPTTVDRAGPILAAAKGLRWPEDRPEVVAYLNKYRNLLFNSYEDFKLFGNVFHCICISTFRERCATGSCDDPATYQGFTLPADVAAVEAVWDSGEPLKIRSRWREAMTGIGLVGPRVEVLEMAEQFATERDPNSICALKVWCERDEDAGKHVVIEVIDGDWKTRKLDFELAAGGWVTVEERVREIRSVALPLGRTGSITLAQQDGYELSIYAPDETVPSYRRFKIASTCPAGAVKIQGTRRFRSIYFDSDIVEVGDQLVIESAARFFKYGENTVEANEIRTAAYHKSEMTNYLNGLVARHRGHAIQDQTPFKGRPLPRRTKKLPGYR